MPNFYQLAHEFATQTNQIVFITGKAGTGKTTFLRKLKTESLKQIAVVAPTGIAAINAGGTTIHSFFQLPFSPFIPTPHGRKELISKIKMQSDRQQVLRELELLIIDEISMVRADVLDAIDTVLRHYRHKNNTPFGGVQIIFIGDMFQLSPVAKRDEWQILQNFYAGVYFFNSHVMQQVSLVYIELNKVFRQKNADFIHLLDEVRRDKLTPASFAKLQKLYNPNFIPPTDQSYVTLTTHNYKADLINIAALNKIEAKSYWYKATLTGSFPSSSYPADTELELKKGAKVMFVKNDTETPRRYYNGKIGEITFIDDDYVMVSCPGEEEAIYVEPVTWENITYKVNNETGNLEEKLTGSFTQMPLRHAWAITIHKSQGLTFDNVIIDAGDAFAPGQVYVALSRCRTLEGIVLKSEINEGSIRNETDILKFTSRKNKSDTLKDILKESQEKYRKELLLDLFDFAPLDNTLEYLIIDVNKAGPSFNKETIPFLRRLAERINELKEVGNKFSIQLDNIMGDNPLDEPLLQERLNASAGYFEQKLEVLLESIAESPAYTDNKSHAKSYNDNLLHIYTEIAQKKILIVHLCEGFTIENYFKWRKNMQLDLPKFKTYGGSNTKPKISIHPDLMQRLTTIRNDLAQENNVAPYVVAKTKSLQELADYLPQTPKDFLLIYGFGKVRLEKYGTYFLEEIRSYCAENNLSSRMNEIRKDEKKEVSKPSKKEKGASQKESLQLYTAGKTLDEIATHRNLKIGTIASHLSEFLKTGEVDINNFVSNERRQEALKLIKEHPKQSVYKTLYGFFDATELKFFTTWLRLQDNDS